MSNELELLCALLPAIIGLGSLVVIAWAEAPPKTVMRGRVDNLPVEAQPTFKTGPEGDE